MQEVSFKFDSLVKNKTWILLSSPPNENIVGNKWVFQIKFWANGPVERFESRLVTQVLVLAAPDGLF